MESSFYKITILNTSAMINESSVISNEISFLLININRNDRFEIFSYQQKRTGNTVCNSTKSL
jgi:hypothetical protein